MSVKTEINLASWTCSECGVTQAMPQRLYDQRRDDGKDFYCVNGHGRVFREPTIQVLERQLAKERAARDQAEAHARTLTKSLSEANDKLTKAKTRAKNGVCPCCNRTFAALARHMKAKHPDFK